MNPAEEIVKFWLQNKGYYYQSSIRLPHNKEIDILSIDEQGNKSHIEVSVSVRMANYKFNAEELAQDFYERKFKDVEEEVIKRIGSKYDKKLVVGKVMKGNENVTEDFIKSSKKLGVEIILFKDILNFVRPLLLTNSHLNPIIKTIQLTEVFEK